MIKNYIKIRQADIASALLQFNYQQKNYRIDFLNTGFDAFNGAPGKNSPYPFRHQHSHPVFHLLMFYEGSYHYLHNNKRINFSPGTFTVTCPNEPHKFGPFPSKQTASYFFLTFSVVNIETGDSLVIDFKNFMEIFIGEKVEVLSTPVQFNKRQMAIFENLTSILTGQLHSTAPFCSFSAGMTMLDIINFILHECYRNHRNDDLKKVNSPLENAKIYIEGNFTRPIMISELASIAAFEPSYFIRKFKETYHVTPINYQMELKINAARTLLQTTDFRINEIAERVGINDIYYFSRLFKKLSGTSPAAFRKNKTDFT